MGELATLYCLVHLLLCVFANTSAAVICPTLIKNEISDEDMNVLKAQPPPGVCVWRGERGEDPDLGGLCPTFLLCVLVKKKELFGVS